MIDRRGFLGLLSFPFIGTWLEEPARIWAKGPTKDWSGQKKQSSMFYVDLTEEPPHALLCIHEPTGTVVIVCRTAEGYRVTATPDTPLGEGLLMKRVALYPAPGSSVLRCASLE